MAITLPPLPYAKDALEPHISSQTLDFHYGKHHQTYVDKVNAATGDAKSDDDLDDLVMNGSGALFNNAAQIWNHTFYWNSLSPDGGGEPQGALREAIDKAFGSVDAAKEKLAEEATNHFGSGWAWLVAGPDGLEIVSTHDAENPMRQGKTPLLTLDVWEHAYYLDWQNARPKYLKAVIDNLLNWRFAESNYAKATAG
jgi:Fe-Mn family superoxide dismutase